MILNDLVQSSHGDQLQFIPIVTNRIVELGWLDRSPQLAGHVIRRFETGYRPVRGLPGELIGWAARKAVFERHCRTLVRRICENPATQSADLIWAILDCPTVIQVASDVARQLNKPMVVLVWDDPELLIDQFHLDRWSANNLRYRFGATIRQAERVGVICEQMQQSYTRNLGAKDCVVLRHGVREELCRSPTPNISDNRLTIGFAGSITAQSAFRQLIAALNDDNWKVAGREVRLRLIGSRYTLDSRQPQHIEYFGWRDPGETIGLLSECDVLYLPQPFEPQLRPLAELSFPTKLSTYLAAGRRVLLHAPDYASLAPFLEKHPVGLRCCSLDKSAVRDSLEQICRLLAANVANAIHQARHDEFNEAVFLNRFAQLVGGTVAVDGSKPTTADEVAQHV